MTGVTAAVNKKLAVNVTLAVTIMAVTTRAVVCSCHSGAMKFLLSEAGSTRNTVALTTVGLAA